MFYWVRLFIYLFYLSWFNGYVGFVLFFCVFTPVFGLGDVAVGGMLLSVYVIDTMFTVSSYNSAGRTTSLSSLGNR